MNIAQRIKAAAMRMRDAGAIIDSEADADRLRARRGQDGFALRLANEARRASSMQLLVIRLVVLDFLAGSRAAFL
jgi:hypothetical protein